MDTVTPAPLPSPPASPEDAPSRRPGRRSSRAGQEQPRLPLGDLDEAPERGAVRDEDDEHDRPIGFALTARARRAVAPHSLPDLAVVQPGPVPNGGHPEPADDTRPARARALRRAGVSISRIAGQLDADPLLVTAWAGEVVVRAHRSGRSDGTSAAPGAATSVAEEPRGRQDHEQVTARALVRAEATRRAQTRLAEDAVYALAAGLLAAVAEVDEHAVTVTTDDERIAGRALQALTALLPQAGTLARVVVRVGPEAAGDLVRHRAAAALGIDVSQVTWTRWRAAPRADAIRLLLRVADPALADDVAGVIDAVLDPSPCPAGDDF
ncbi:MAG: hypothetical protein ACNA8R_05415 [Nitriliruptoraceae bacterium]